MSRERRLANPDFPANEKLTRLRNGHRLQGNGSVDRNDQGIEAEFTTIALVLPENAVTLTRS
jgi:hypothetical protein